MSAFSIKIVVFLLLLSGLSISSCKKEIAAPTQGQITAAKLQKVMAKGDIVYVYNVDGTSAQSEGRLVNISNDGYIMVAYQAVYATYNLSLLKKYFNVVLSNGNNWFLYF
ncbi:MAG: hypothetical protein EKK39_06250 [Sphingobacteriales bacterium]|uniref:hypothetical protein n=1 Tax=Hydrotalea flava TaxID=714549 RepID=UPI00082E309F|nr:hypothetical protein [Hydrotalea flava]RTL52776.1 MAG: hypothetical protein EKK39_06250 [Sphingobacteriales bacterium]